MLVIIHWALGVPQDHLQGDQSWGQGVRYMLRLFKCSWLNLGASPTVGCGIWTGGLRVSMRFNGPEEVGVVAVSRTPGSRLVSVFASGASLSDAASPSEGEGEGAEGSGKSEYSSAWGVESPQVPPLIWVFLAF
jgi:hypothetical protein